MDKETRERTIDKVAIFFAMQEDLPPKLVRDYVVVLHYYRKNRLGTPPQHTRERQDFYNACGWEKFGAMNGRLVSLCKKERLL